MNGVRTNEGAAATQLVYCPDCGTVHGDATELLAQVQRDLDNAEQELRVRRRQIKKLRIDAYASILASPFHPIATRILERWRELCDPQARELEGARMENCVARLKGKYSEDDLNLSVDGYARFPFVVDRGRSHIGTPAQWHADAELIFRSPRHVNNGIRLAEQQTAEVPYALLGVIPWQRVRELNRRAILVYLRTRFGGLLEEDGYVYSPCPRCDDGTSMHTPLTVAPLGLSYLVECRKCGLDEGKILGLLRRRPHYVKQEGALQLELIA